MALRVIALALLLFDFRCGQAEEEEVLRAHFLANLDVCAVQGADGESAVHGELHVAGSGGFLAGQGDLLGKVGGRIDSMAEFHAEVGEKDYFQPSPRQRVTVDDLADGVNELDDELGHAVAGGGFSAKDKGARHNLGRRIAVDALEQGNDMQDLQMLALVLVQSLDQHIEHGCRIGSDGEAILNVVREPCLVLQLDGSPLLVQFAVGRPAAQAGAASPDRESSRCPGAQ